jgi:hypothetical protein
MKATARNSKPLFRAIAIVWFKKNCPKLITTWLHSQVTFDKLQKAKEVAYVQENSPVEPPETSYPKYSSREIKQLRSQVRLLASTSAIAIVAFAGSMMMWISNTGVKSMPTSEPLKTLPENAKAFK